MEKRLLEFINLLRNSGVKISTGEVMECMQGVECFGIENRAKFYHILAATLIKSETDMGIFDLGFRLFFQGEPKPIKMSSPGECDNLARSVDGSGMGKAGMGIASTNLYQAIINNQSQALMEMVQEKLKDLDVENIKVDQLLHSVKVDMEWFMVENALDCAGEKDEQHILVLKDLERYLRQSIERLVGEEKGPEGIKDILNEESLRKKDFHALNEAQVKEMEKRVERLAKKLASRYSYRLKPAKTGKIDMRRVMQQFSRSGRLPGKFLFQDKFLDQPQVIVLCDISGSVAIYSSFLLQLIYAMAKRFRDIKTFLFVDEVAEVTPDLQQHSLRDAIYQILKNTRCSRIGISNFGQVFELFKHKYAQVLNPKTSLIILGDAKNNWYPPHEEELQVLSQKVKQVIWLNPQPEKEWDKDDSVMSKYASYCSEVLECRNLEQLERAVRKIMN